MDLRNGDCLELMKTIPDKSVDLFICDLPYGETNCKWDTKIDMEAFWKEFKRIRKSKRTACIHFCSTKFGYSLIKSWEKGFKMDMVLKKRNKTGGLQSRHRPMRNHEMVYFFYEQAPKYNRDKYHKRIQTQSVGKEKNEFGFDSGKENFNKKSFEPPNPASVVEETDPWGCKNGGAKGRVASFGAIGFDPPNPASVIEEESDIYGETKSQMKARGKGFGHGFDPPNPASVLEEEEKQEEQGRKMYKNTTMGNIYLKKAVGAVFEPPNPASVVEEPEPASMFESTKVFIGKRHHQTEKPQDILEFFLKYWTDEEDTVLDPTMGSGSTGVACKKLNRKFIGFEMDEKIFKVAKKRNDIT